MARLLAPVLHPGLPSPRASVIRSCVITPEMDSRCGRFALGHGGRVRGGAV